jgi:hypothetical protein
MLRLFPKLKVGIVFGVTVTGKVVETPHWFASGVKR